MIIGTLPWLGTDLAEGEHATVTGAPYVKRFTPARAEVLWKTFA
jgi:hypothetical protein